MQKSGKFIKIKRTILNAGFLSAIAIIPTNLMALSIDGGGIGGGLACLYILDTCMEAAKTSTMKYCCDMYDTNGNKRYVDYTICPSGCTGGGTGSTTCTCSSLSGLSDSTGTYNGTSCTGTGTTTNKPCAQLSASSKDSKGNACATVFAN